MPNRQGARSSCEPSITSIPCWREERSNLWHNLTFANFCNTCTHGVYVCVLLPVSHVWIGSRMPGMPVCEVNIHRMKYHILCIRYHHGIVCWLRCGRQMMGCASAGMESLMFICLLSVYWRANERSTTYMARELEWSMKLMMKNVMNPNCVQKIGKTCHLYKSLFR